MYAHNCRGGVLCYYLFNITFYWLCLFLSIAFIFHFFKYRIGQLYMIARHSFEQSSNGEGVEVVANEQINDEKYGTGQFTEKRIHLSRYSPVDSDISLYKQTICYCFVICNSFFILYFYY